MIRISLKLALAGMATSLLLAGCVSGPTLAPAGSLAVGDGYSVTLDRNWSDVTGSMGIGKAPKVRVLTVDGVLLERLHVSQGLTSADPLMVSQTTGDTTNSPALRGKGDMSLSEQMEFVAQSVTALDYHKVETANPKPVQVGAVKGVRFELTAVTSEGLNIKGLAQAVSSNGKSYYIVYLAPAEHYYDAYLKNVTAVMDSAKLP